MLVLNIGLKRGEALLNVANVKAACYARIPGMVPCGTYDSDTEPTLVIIPPAGAAQYRTLYALGGISDVYRIDPGFLTKHDCFKYFLFRIIGLEKRRNIDQIT